MSKPKIEIGITTPDERTVRVMAVFDTGSFHSIVREDKVPSAATIVPLKRPRMFSAAVKGSELRVTGQVFLIMTIGDRSIEDAAFVAPDLSQDLLIGAGAMQKWDISIVNRNGKTEITVGRDMHDPDVTEVD